MSLALECAVPHAGRTRCRCGFPPAPMPHVGLLAPPRAPLSPAALTAQPLLSTPPTPPCAAPALAPAAVAAAGSSRLSPGVFQGLIGPVTVPLSLVSPSNPTPPSPRPWSCLPLPSPTRPSPPVSTAIVGVLCPDASSVPAAEASDDEASPRAPCESGATWASALPRHPGTLSDTRPCPVLSSLLTTPPPDPPATRAPFTPCVLSHAAATAAAVGTAWAASAGPFPPSP